jgi:transmembrane 9 superfamily protein 2/4
MVGSDPISMLSGNNKQLTGFCRILDNLPVAMRISSDNGVYSGYDRGFRVGVKDSLEKGSTEHKYFINNHLSFKVQYHNDGVSETSRIVGFDVRPYR